MLWLRGKFITHVVLLQGEPTDAPMQCTGISVTAAPRGPTVPLRATPSWAHLLHLPWIPLLGRIVVERVPGECSSKHSRLCIKKCEESQSAPEM